MKLLLQLVLMLLAALAGCRILTANISDAAPSLTRPPPHHGFNSTLAGRAERKQFNVRNGNSTALLVNSTNSTDDENFSAHLPAELNFAGASDDIKIRIWLERNANTSVRAFVKHTAGTGIHIYAFNNIFDDRNVHKLNVSWKLDEGQSPRRELDFKGIIPQWSGEFVESNWYFVPADGTTVTMDINDIYDMDGRKAGKLAIKAEGIVKIKTADGKVQPSEYHYEAQEIVLDWDPGNFFRGDLAVEPQMAMLIDPKCNSENNRYLHAALELCNTYSKTAAYNIIKARNSANSTGGFNNPRFDAYFHRDQNIIGDGDWAVLFAICKFQALASACDDASKFGDLNTVECQDDKNECDDDTYAITQPLTGRVLICPAGWNLPHHALKCHTPDLATTLIHQTSHIRGIHYATLDHDFGFGGQRWPGCKNMPSTKLALSNAETYASFAQSVYLNCNPPEEEY